jgi:hypothetical protein
MTKTISRLGWVPLLAGLVLAALAVEAAPETGPAKANKEAQRNAEKMITALKLKDWGWGTNRTAKTVENASVDMLITAARMLKELPQPKKLEVKPIVTNSKDAPKGTDTKLSEAQEFDPGKEADAILKRAEDILAVDPGLEAKRPHYEALIKDVRNMPRTKAPAGGPKVVQRAIGPMQTHSYSWDWTPNESGMVSFQSATAMRVQVVQESGGVVFADSVISAGTPTFQPSGKEAVKITVRVQNLEKKPALYVVGAQ